MKQLLRISRRQDTKLGNIPSFSTLPGVTCPGRSTWCTSPRVEGGKLMNCYGTKAPIQYPSTFKAWEHNTKYFNYDSFMWTWEKMFPKKQPKVFRLFVAGDFANLSALDAWEHIVEALPQTTFYGYTRTWRDCMPIVFRSLLDDFRDQPNVVLLASMDSSLIRANEWPSDSWRISHIVEKGENQKDMKFSSFSSKWTNKEHTAVKQVERKAVLCPHYVSGTKCESCGFCSNKREKRNLALPIH